LTVHLPEDLARRVTEVAEARHVSPEQVAIETISSHLEAVTSEQPTARRHLAFAAIGSSGSSRGSAEADELLAEGFGRD
jgi:predicted transcriptional regulator